MATAASIVPGIKYIFSLSEFHADFCCFVFLGGQLGASVADSEDGGFIATFLPIPSALICYLNYLIKILDYIKIPRK